MIDFPLGTLCTHYHTKIVVQSNSFRSLEEQWPFLCASSNVKHNILCILYSHSKSYAVEESRESKADTQQKMKLQP